MFVHLIEYGGMKRTYIPGFPGLKEAFYVHYRLIQEYIPKVFKHFVIMMIIN